MFEIQSFGLGQPIVHTSPEYLGGKGAGLVWMDSQGVPVPPGFILPTTLWWEYKTKPKTTLKLIKKQIAPWLAKMREHFGYAPLLSVRSGARVSCPGMMDTLLNVGLEASNQDFWSKKLGPACYYDSLHRLVTMYGSVVTGLDRKTLESLPLAEALALHSETTGAAFPGAEAQLLSSIEAVFKSWDNERAKFYRKMNNIPAEWGTACTVQAMVFGNLNDNSGTGVLFTRNPDTGEAKVTGEFLVNAQGEDVVAGIKTPMPLEGMSNWNDEVHTKLITTVLNLEALRKDVQDVEFTIQDGKLYILQTRGAKRSAKAAVRIATDMLTEGLIGPEDLAKRVSARDMDLSQQPVLDPSFKTAPDFTGIPACSGVVFGRAVFSSQAAVEAKAKGEAVILVTDETTPDDIAGMDAAVGVLTMTGGATSHAAVVARGMNKTCVVGLGNHMGAFSSGVELTIDGSTGNVWFLKAPVVEGDPAAVEFLMSMIRKAKGASPVLMDVPAVELEEAWFLVGANVLDPDVTVAKIVKTLSKVQRLVVDLETLRPDEEVYLTQMHAGLEDQVALLHKLEDALKKVPNAAQRVSILGAISNTFQTVGTTNDLQSLILAEGEVVVTKNAENNKAMDKVMGWKKAEGVSFVTVGMLGGDKSYLSDAQTLQL